MSVEDRTTVSVLFLIVIALNLVLNLRIEALSRIVRRMRPHPPTPRMFRSSRSPRIVPAWPEKED